MEIFSVSQFNIVLNTIFGDLPVMGVTGEVTSIKVSKNQGVFIELKDTREKALLKVSNYKPNISGINLISEGMQVVVYGRPDVYSPAGFFSFKPYKIEPVGEGSLKIAFEKLKLLLESEGLFSPQRKRHISGPITRIALITGKDSAAYADFIKILSEHNQNLEVDFFPVLVQGEQSESEIVQALAEADSLGTDVIVLTRGGGSLEDLKSFNSELVARKISTSRTPVICAVGHEIDTSIADMVADVRASTPSQAAYYLVGANQRIIEEMKQELQSVESLLVQKIPNMNQAETRLENALRNVEFQIRNNIMKASQFSNLSGQITNILNLNIQHTINKQQLLAAFNPDNVLGRGFALVHYNGKYVSDISSMTSGEQLDIKFKTGEVNAVIQKIKIN